MKPREKQANLYYNLNRVQSRNVQVRTVSESPFNLNYQKDGRMQNDSALPKTTSKTVL